MNEGERQTFEAAAEGPEPGDDLLACVLQAIEGKREHYISTSDYDKVIFQANTYLKSKVERGDSAEGQQPHALPEPPSTPPTPQPRMKFGDWCDMLGVMPTMGRVEEYVREMLRAEVEPKPTNEEIFISQPLSLRKLLNEVAIVTNCGSVQDWTVESIRKRLREAMCEYGQSVAGVEPQPTPQPAWIQSQTISGICERLQSMLDYSYHHSKPGMDLNRTVEELSQMFRGEISRLSGRGMIPVPPQPEPQIERLIGEWERFYTALPDGEYVGLGELRLGFSLLKKSRALSAPTPTEKEK